MRESRGIVWGGLLVLIGALWLLNNMDMLHVDWNAVLPYWPVLLILAGVVVLLSRKEGGKTGGVAGLLIALAIFAAVTNKTSQKFRNRDNWKFNWNDERWNHNDDDEDNDDDDHDKWRNEPEGKLNRDFEYDMEDFIQKGFLNLEGGAGSFKLKGTTDKLFKAHTKSNVVGFVSTKSINKLENSATVNLKMEEGDVTIKNGRIPNEATVELNTSPLWTVDLGIGAGKGDFDFSPFKVEKLKISTGVADMDLRLGDKADNTVVNIEAGVASVTIEVPESVGCEVSMDGALNIKSMDDFDKVNNGLYRSPNYDKSTRKIKINFEGGLSKVKIRRY